MEGIIIKLIDDRGRLFNIINVIDLAIILVVLMVAFGAYTKLMGGGQAQDSADSEQEITITVKYTPLDEEELTAMKAGDQLFANNQLQAVFVQAVEIRPEQVLVEEDGELFQADHPFDKNLYLTVRGQADVTETNIQLANQIVRVGREFIIKTMTAEFAGTVTKIEL